MGFGLTILVAAGLLATYAGALDFVQSRISAGVETSVADVSVDLRADFIESVNSVQTSEAEVNMVAGEAITAIARSTEALATHESGVATLSAFAAPIYATSTARARLLAEGRFHTIVISTDADISVVRQAAAQVEEAIDVDTEIYLLPEGVFVATVGRYETESMAEESRIVLAQIVRGPYTLNMGEACPRREEADGFIRCRPRIGE